jgi:hypothetical protein
VAAVRVVDEQAALIEGETQPIRPVEVVDQQGEGSPVGLDAIHSLEAHLLGPRHPVELDPPVWRIREIDRPIALHHHVIRAVELLPIEVAGEHGEGAAGFGAGHAAGRVFARDEPPLAVVGEAVGHMARPAEGRDALFPAPPADVVAGDIGEQEESLVGVPERAFRKEKARPDLLELDVGAGHGGEAPVANLDVHGRSLLHPVDPLSPLPVASPPASNAQRFDARVHRRSPY